MHAPPLPYAPDALAPLLSAGAVKLHQDVYVEAYAAGLQEALASEAQGRMNDETSATKQRAYLSIADAISYNSAGLAWHTMYWANLFTPEQGGVPSRALHQQISADFGSPRACIRELTDVGLALHGNGWLVLAFSSVAGKLVPVAVHGHTQGWGPGLLPLLVIDLWEHAYMVDYPGKKAEYLRAIWSLVNWNTVNARFASVRR